MNGLVKGQPAGRERQECVHGSRMGVCVCLGNCELASCLKNSDTHTSPEVISLQLLAISSSFISVAVLKYPEGKQVRGRKGVSFS